MEEKNQEEVKPVSNAGVSEDQMLKECMDHVISRGKLKEDLDLLGVDGPATETKYKTITLGHAEGILALYDGLHFYPDRLEKYLTDLYYRDQEDNEDEMYEKIFKFREKYKEGSLKEHLEYIYSYIYSGKFEEDLMNKWKKDEKIASKTEPPKKKIKLDREKASYVFTDKEMDNIEEDLNREPMYTYDNEYYRYDLDSSTKEKDIELNESLIDLQI